MPIIAITESWLKDHISDAQITIPNYEIIRQDRKVRARGGVILYVHNTLPVSDVSTYEDGTCEAVICTIKSINTKAVAVYRPPGSADTDVQSFGNLLSFLHNKLNTGEDKHTDLLIMGDFNFPGIKWCENPRKYKINDSTCMQTRVSIYGEFHRLVTLIYS